MVSSLSSSSQCSTVFITKAIECAILSVGWCIFKNTFLLNWKGYIVTAYFLCRYLSGPLQYLRCHITVNVMCWVHCWINHSFIPYLIHHFVDWSLSRGWWILWHHKQFWFHLKWERCKSSQINWDNFSEPVIRYHFFRRLDSLGRTCFM